ncbi:MAG: PP2C family protein-serine/threonine phosphatase, partial [Gammaproteobacteria bacterium]
MLIDHAGRATFLRDEQFSTIELLDWPAGHARLAVLDGMGGHGHGREAAEAAVLGLIGLPACSRLDALCQHLDALHAQLQRDFAGAVPAERRPGTTLTLLELPADGAPLLYHVGDSRLYEIADDKVTPLTVDHVPTTALAMEGLLGEREWWQHVHGEHRPQIAQAFILGNAFQDPLMLADPLYPLTPANLPGFLWHLPDRRALALRPDADYLLATDGFWSCDDPLAWVERWPALFKAHGSAGEKLAALFEAMERTPPSRVHPDNLTAIVLSARRAGA